MCVEYIQMGEKNKVATNYIKLCILYIMWAQISSMLNYKKFHKKDHFLQNHHHIISQK